RTAVDAQGRDRFCFVTRDGNQAPNLRAKPGDEVVITLKNQAKASPNAIHPATHHTGSASCTPGPVTSLSVNLHFHGFVIPPKCHQVDPLSTAVESSDTPFEYRFKIPKDQPPGIYWYHPHIHGIARAQLLGGASGALIVQGIESANRQVRGLEERVFVIRD